MDIKTRLKICIHLTPPQEIHHKYRGQRLQVSLRKFYQASWKPNSLTQAARFDSPSGEAPSQASQPLDHEWT